MFSASDDSSLNQPTLEMRLERERVDLLYQQNKQGLVALTIYGSSYLFVSWAHHDHLFLVIWAALLYGSGLIRVALTLRWNKVRDGLRSMEQVRPWRSAIHGLLLLSGCLWGAIAVFIPSSTSLSEQIISSVVVIMMSAGAVACYSASFSAVARVCVPAMVPWGLASLAHPDPLIKFIGLLLLLYLVLGLKTAKTSGRFVMDSLRLSFENTRLAEGLREEMRIKDETQLALRESERESRELEAANNAKSVLLANVSHEIRTPLAAINGFTEMVLQNPELPSSLRGDVQMILRNGKYLVSLVSDLLDLSKAESGQLYIQKDAFSVVEEIHDIVALVKPSVLAKGLRLELSFDSPVPERIESDATRVREILINVISNAVKFTREGSIEIHVDFLPKDAEGAIRVRVKDTGIGISPAAVKRLFRPFTRGEGEVVQRVPGSGLGLALSRNLARILGGDLILLRSTEGAGSEFEITIGTGDVSRTLLIDGNEFVQRRGEERASAPPDKALRDLEILVVDDAPDLLVLMERFLKKQGAKVETLADGYSAIARAREKTFDFILMDIKMPLIDGYTTTKTLRREGYVAPIVAITAHASAEDRQLCYQSGFDSYVSKPVDFSSLIIELRRLGTHARRGEVTI